MSPLGTRAPSSMFFHCLVYSAPVQVEDSSPLPCLLVVRERGTEVKQFPFWVWPGSSTHFPSPPKSRKLSHMTVSLQERLGHGGSGEELRLWGSIPNREKRLDIGGQFAVSWGNKLRQIDLRLGFRQGGTPWGRCGGESAFPVAIASAHGEWAPSGATRVILCLWQVCLLVGWITEALWAKIKSSILFTNISILYVLLCTDTCG